MITEQNIAALKQAYENELKPSLQSLESERLVIKRRAKGIIYSSLGIVLSFVLSIVGVYHLPLLGVGGFFSIMLCIVLLIIFISKTVKKYKPYKKRFKKEVIEKVFFLINPDLKYNSEAFIPKSTYDESCLFNHEADRYSGDDYVSGKIEKTAFEFSEIISEYKTVSRDSKGNRTVTWHKIFQGIFFIADFNKNIKGKTFILPDLAELVFGKMVGGFLQSKTHGYGQLVRLENPGFEKEFVVYADDQNNARYILTPVIMERILALRKKSGDIIYICFIGSKVYVALSFKGDNFEPRIFSSLVDFSEIQTFYEIIYLTLGIVEDLNLNTRIWTKE